MNTYRLIFNYILVARELDRKNRAGQQDTHQVGSNSEGREVGRNALRQAFQTRHAGMPAPVVSQPERCVC